MQKFSTPIILTQRTVGISNLQTKQKDYFVIKKEKKKELRKRHWMKQQKRACKYVQFEKIETYWRVAAKTSDTRD